MTEATTDTIDAAPGALDETRVSAPGSPSAAPVSRASLIGRYVVLSKLGAGAMGVVFAAYDPQLDRKVALKLLKGEGASPSAHARLQREARALAKLDHPNVVTVHDVGVHDGQLFVGMEFVEGQTLGEWMAAADGPRPWREVVRVFLEAGRGLAAAHEAGLIHRDFKPDNVMLGGDGRVRVMDFGLARADRGEGGGEGGGEGEGEGEAGPGPAGDDTSPAGAGAEALDLTSATLEESGTMAAALTQTGALMGTPAYMSMEQLEGRAADARSDQFAFCVALYQALYGERPFEGRNLAQLVLAVQTGHVKEAPRGTAVPSWLRRVVLRGLDNQPERRHASMHALLDALADDPAIRRRKWWAVAGLVGLVGASAWALTRSSEPASVCVGMDDKLVGVWDDQRRAQVEAALEATKLTYATETWLHARARLDAYADDWVAARAEACTATARGEQSGALLDVRMACLDERLEHLDALVEILAQADEGIAQRAVQVASSLPRLERCTDVEALMAEVPPPEDPATAARVSALERSLVAASAQRSAGKYDAALASVSAIVSEAEALAYAPLEARALLRKGDIQTMLGDYEPALASLERGYSLALAHDMLDVAASAATELVALVGYHQANPSAGRAWALHSAALVQNVGTDQTQILHLDSLGLLAGAAGDHHEARELHERALEIQERVFGPDHIEIANTLNTLAATADILGDHDTARAEFERALAIQAAALGPGHPALGRTLNNLGILALHQGDYEAAKDYQLRALALKREALGPDHPDLANTITNLGVIADALDRKDESREHHERALALREAALGPDHPAVAASLYNLGTLASHRDDLAQAHAHYARALAIDEAALGPDHPDLAYDLAGLGEVLLRQGEHGEALAAIERALSLRSASGVTPTLLASNHLLLARALWEAPEGAGRDRPRARALAELARTAYASAGPGSAKELSGAETWLREHELSAPARLPR